MEVSSTNGTDRHTYTDATEHITMPQLRLVTRSLTRSLWLVNAVTNNQ